MGAINKSPSKFNLTNKAKAALYLLFKGEISSVINAIKLRFSSSYISIGMRRDLFDDFEIPKAKIDINIRLYKKSDFNSLNENYRHIQLVKQNIPTCYIAETKGGIPCFKMWLFKSTENIKIKKFFDNLFFQLKPNEAIVEGVFTAPNFRGKKIMPLVLSKIIESIKSDGIRWVYAFIKINNLASIKGFYNAGFNPYILRKVEWKFFRRSVTFMKIPKSMMKDYNLKVGLNVSK